MNKVMIFGLGALFIVAVFIGGCGKSEEKKAEAPTAGAEAVTQEVATDVEKAVVEGDDMMEEAASEGREMMEEAASVAGSAMEKAEGMAGEAAEEMEEMGEKAEEMKEMSKKAVDTAMEHGEDMMKKAKTEAAKVVE